MNEVHCLSPIWQGDRALGHSTGLILEDYVRLLAALRTCLPSLPNQGGQY